MQAKVAKILQEYFDAEQGNRVTAFSVEGLAARIMRALEESNDKEDNGTSG